MRSTVLACLLLILPSPQLFSQAVEPSDPAPQVENALPEDPADVQPEERRPADPGEPEVIIEPPGAEPAPDGNSIAADEDETDTVDVPGRVARLSLIEGEVSIAPAGTEELAEAVLNRPLTSGDRVLVDSGGRAELQLGNATIYLDGGAALSLIELSDGGLRASLSEGTAVIRVRRKQLDETFEVLTPNTSIELLSPGEYSIVADASGTRTTLRTRSGEAKVSSAAKSFRVRAKQQGEFTGPEKLVASIGELRERTLFESFANERERRDLESRSASHVSRDVIGYEDLDEHGDWIEEPEYGYVWRPRYVDASWVPYRYGRWAFIAPWGWTWIDNARWGFAPFHYGRWAYLRNRWYWVPGPRRYRPVYAPALVGWTGRTTLNVSVAFGGGIGWFPLAPRELYVPPYRYSQRYARNLNVSNTIIVNNTFSNNIYRSGGPQGWRNARQSAFLDYRYRRQATAVTLVERGVFVGGGAIDGRFRRLDERQWQRMRHDGIPPVIDPQRSSLLAARPVPRASDWQQRFARVERRDRSGSATTVSESQLVQPSRAREAQAPRTRINGFSAGRSPSDGSDLRRWRDLRVDEQARPRRWQDQRGDEQSQPRRWQERGGDEQSQPRRWQERGGDEQPQPRRWQERGGDEQPQARRWQGRGDGQSQAERWQDRATRAEPRPEQRRDERRHDDGRRGWQQQQRSEGRGQPQRGGSGQSRWQRQ